MKEIQVTPDYDDRVPKISAALLAGLLICSIGMREKLMTLLIEHTTAVTVVFLFSAGLAWCLVHYVSWLTRRLDVRWPWHTVFGRRLMRQLMWGVVLPAGVVLCGAIIFFRWLPQPVAIGNTDYFYSDFPLSVLLLILLNGCYGFAYNNWFVTRLQDKMEELHNQHRGEIKKLQGTVTQLKAENVELKTKVNDLMAASLKEQKYMLFEEDGAKHAIPYADIAYFCVERETTEAGGPKYCVKVVLMDETVYVAKESSLIKVGEVTHNYFKYVNRKHLVAPHAIEKATVDKKQKFTLVLRPNQREVNVGKEASKRLKEWVMEHAGTVSGEITGEA